MTRLRLCSGRNIGLAWWKALNKYFFAQVYSLLANLLVYVILRTLPKCKQATTLNLFTNKKCIREFWWQPTASLLIMMIDWPWNLSYEYCYEYWLTASSYSCIFTHVAYFATQELPTVRIWQNVFNHMTHRHTISERRKYTILSGCRNPES